MRQLLCWKHGDDYEADDDDDNSVDDAGFSQANYFVIF